MAIRVGRWDCASCGRKGNLGPQTRCESCGDRRPENVRFYLPSDAEMVNDEAQLRAARAGADWICGHCSGHNKVQHQECQSCGNPRDERSEDVELAVKEYVLGDVPQQGRRKEDEAGERYRALHATQTGRSFNKFRSITRLGGLGVMGLLIVGAIWLWAFPKSIEVEVSGFRWERSIQFEQYEAVQQEAWQLPGDAFDVQSFQAIHHYNKVLKGYETRTRQVKVKVGEERYVCGQRDLGNGYFEDKYCTRPIYDYQQETYEEPVYENIPVYQTRYRFQVMAWNAAPAYKRRQGGNDQQARWPELPGAAESWRAVEKAEAYFVQVQERNGRTHEEQVPFRFWESLEPGQRLAAKKTRLIGTFRGLSIP